MIATYLYAVQCLEINSITHKYLIRGHTQNEGDAIHSVIEKSVTKIKRSGPIYVPEQYISAIRSAKKNGNPLEVKEMNFDSFLDIKFIHDEMALTLTQNVDGNDFKISDVKLLKTEKGNAFFKYKTSYKQVEWNCVGYKSKKRRISEVNHSMRSTESQHIQKKFQLLIIKRKT